MANITLKGSERASMPGARVVAPADPTERLEVTVLVRRRAREALHVLATQLAAGTSSAACMSREEFAARHGADAADLAAVRTFAAAHGLVVVLEHAARRTVMLSGTVAQFNAAFSVRLQRMQHDSCSYRGRTGSIQLPSSLEGVVEAVLGLDSRPQAEAHFRIRPAASAATSFTPPQVASLYGFPASTGLGQCVALIELGGGFRPADLDTYFKGLGVGSPTVTAVSVDHAQNAPTGDANGPDGEVMLDIEVVGAIVPQATIAVYFAPNTDRGFSMPSPPRFMTRPISRRDFHQLGRGGIELDIAGDDGDGRCFSGGRDVGVTVCVAPAITAPATASPTAAITWIFPLRVRSRSAAAAPASRPPQASSAGKWFGMTAQRRRERRRHQLLLCDAHLAGEFERRDGSGNAHAVEYARRARYRRECRSGDRL